MKIKHVPGVHGPTSGHSEVVFEVVDTPVIASQEKFFICQLLKWNFMGFVVFWFCPREKLGWL